MHKKSAILIFFNFEQSWYFNGPSHLKYATTSCTATNWVFFPVTYSIHNFSMFNLRKKATAKTTISVSTVLITKEDKLPEACNRCTNILVSTSSWLQGETSSNGRVLLRSTLSLAMVKNNFINNYLLQKWEQFFLIFSATKKGWPISWYATSRFRLSLVLFLRLSTI